jgi:hypothetical protein
MIQIQLDPFKTAEQNVFDHMDEGDNIVHQFEVVPFDYRVNDRSTPTFFVTTKSLYFAYDDLMELIPLSGLEMDILGEAPKFSPWQLWFEGKSYYSETQGESFRKLKNATYYSRLSFNEKGLVPKEFALRVGPNVAYSYQSWAMAQLLINQKNDLQVDQRLQELFKGNFSKYNKYTIGSFILVMLVYVLLKGLLGDWVEAIGVILDVLFGGVSAYMFWWIYKSMEKNLLRFKAVYDGYAVTYTREFDGGVNENSKSVMENVAQSEKVEANKQNDNEKKLVEALQTISEINSAPEVPEIIQEEVTKQAQQAQPVVSAPVTQTPPQAQAVPQQVQPIAQQSQPMQQPIPQQVQPQAVPQPIQQPQQRPIQPPVQQQVTQPVQNVRPAVNSNSLQNKAIPIQPRIINTGTQENLNKPAQPTK